jgi:hypothetical protein
MIIVGGIELSTSGLVSSKEAAKERILNAILGLVLALFSWLLLYTINPDLLKGDVNIDESTITSERESYIEELDEPQIPVTKIVDGVVRKVVKGIYNEGYIGQSWTGDKTAIPSGVEVGYKECTTVGERGCLSTKGLNVSYLKTLKSGCSKCEIVLTEGSAYWLHSNTTSHGSGSATVDLRVTPTLTTYIAQGRPLIYNTRYEINGISCLYEKPKNGTLHWHCGP